MRARQEQDILLQIARAYILASSLVEFHANLRQQLFPVAQPDLVNCRYLLPQAFETYDFVQQKIYQWQLLE
jgi:hypothetical protein